MQSSSMPMEAEPSIELTLANIESFYTTIVTQACDQNNPNQPTAQRILNGYIAYLDSLLVYNPAWRLKKSWLSEQIKLLSEQNVFSEATEIAKIQQDILNDGQLISVNFDDNSAILMLIETLNHIYLQKNPVVVPVFKPPAPEIGRRMYLHLSWARTLDKILHEGNQFFQIGRLEEAISVYIKGEFILEAGTNTHAELIPSYATKIKYQLAKAYYYFSLGQRDLEHRINYLQLASETSAHLEPERENIWLEAELQLLIINNSKSYLLLTDDREKSIIIWKNCFNSIENIIAKFPKIRKSHFVVFDQILINLINAQTVKYNKLNATEYSAKIKLARENIAVIGFLSDAPSNQVFFDVARSFHKNVVIHTINILFEPASKSLPTQNKIDLLLQAIAENKEHNQDFNSIAGINHYNFFTNQLIRCVYTFIYECTPKQIADLADAITKTFNEIPTKDQLPFIKLAHADLLKSLALRLVFLSFFLEFSQRDHAAMLQIKNNYVLAIKIAKNINEEFLYPIDKSNILLWRQYLIIYTLRSMLLNPKYGSTKNINTVTKVIAQYMQDITPSTDYLFNRSLDSIAYFLFQYAKMIKDYSAKIYLLETTIALIEKMDASARTDQDNITILLMKKFLQYENANEILTRPFIPELEDNLNLDVLTMIAAINTVKYPALENFDNWFIFLLHDKQKKIRSAAETYLDELIDELADKLVTKPYFFSPLRYEEACYRELRELFHDQLKPLKQNKCFDRYAEAIHYLEEYFNNLPKVQLEVLNEIHNAINILTQLDADDDYLEYKPSRRNSM